MIKIDKPKGIFAAFILVILYSCLSLVYFGILDPRFYVKNIFNCGITFAVPIPYIILITLFIFLSSSLLKVRARTIAWPLIAMAVALPLFYLLTDLKILMQETNPFGGNRGIYGIYAIAYTFFLISLFSISIGLIFRNLIKKKIFIFHLPILIYFAYIDAILFLNGFIWYGAYLLILSILALSCESITVLLSTMKRLLVKFISNEKLFLITIFAIAFLVRYFWGARLLGIAGDKFIMASDDGLCYDEFASILAKGELIPKEGLYAVSGFGYWYFLAAVYKIFGLHNFKAVYAVQSFIGAFVPVLTYFIGKKIFKTSFVPVLASILVSFDMTLIFLSVVIGMEAIYIPLLLLALAAAVHLFGQALNYKKAFLLGSLFGLAYNARPPELLFFPFVLASIVLYVVIKDRLSRRYMIGIIASLFTGFILLASMQYLTNYALYGERSPSLQNAVLESFSDGVIEVGHGDENAILGRMGFSPFKDFGRSLLVLKDNPATVLVLIVKGFFKRLAILYFLPNFGVFDPVYLVNPGSGYFFRFPVYLLSCGYLLTAWGIFASFLRRGSLIGTVTIFSFLAYMSARVAFFFVLNSRYRGLLLPIFMLFFAYGVEALYRKTKDAYIKYYQGNEEASYAK